MRILIYVCFLALVCMLMLSSCGFNHWKSKGLEKGWLSSDTTHQNIITPKTEKDTIFKHTRDTVTLKEKQLTVKYFYNTKDSTVYLSGKCESDTIRVEKVINTINQLEDQNKWIYLAIIGGLIVLLLFFNRK